MTSARPDVYKYSGLQALFVTVFQTSVDLLCKKSYKSSSVLPYFDWFQLNHTVRCCNINFSCLSQIRREKFALQAMYMSRYFCCTFLRDCSCFVTTFHQLFTLWPPNFFVLAPLFRLIACWKRFFSECSWVIFEKGTEKENLQAEEVSKHRSKKLFFALFCALNQTFFAVPARHRWETCKEKASLLLIKKNKEPGERNEVLNTHFNAHFPQKVPI